MRKLLAALLAFFGVANVHAVQPLAEHQWRDRVLLLYVPGPNDPAVAAFRAGVESQGCGIVDRDLVIGELLGAERGSLDDRTLDPGEVGALRSIHGIDGGRVATVLVGKDGGVKLEVDGVAELQRVFRRIDGMPMRRQEMAARGGDPCK